MDYVTLKENIISDIKDVRVNTTSESRVQSLIDLHDLLLRLEKAQMERESFEHTKKKLWT